MQGIYLRGLCMPLTSFYGTTQDGSINAYVVNKTGETMIAGAESSAGQDAPEEYHQAMFFNTGAEFSSIASIMTIYWAQLLVYVTAGSMGGGMSTLDFYYGNNTLGDSLTTSDYGKGIFYGVKGSWLSGKGITFPGQKTMTLNAAALAVISKTAYTNVETDPTWGSGITMPDYCTLGAQEHGTVSRRPLLKVFWDIAGMKNVTLTNGILTNVD